MNPIQRLGFALVALSMGASVALSTEAEAQSLQSSQGPQLVAQAPTGSGALSRQEVTERLDVVPVFAIVSQDGTPILANIEQEGSQVQVASFWLAPSEAERTVNQIRERNPEIASEAKVVPLSLGYAFQVAEEQRAQNDSVVFQVLPDSSTVQTAIEVVKETEGEDISEFPGVPLFYGRSDEGVLTVEREGLEVVPFFFNRDDLSAALGSADADNAAVANKTQIEVTTLEQVVNSMMDPDAQSDVSKIAFIPSREALEYTQSAIRSGNAGSASQLQLNP